MSTNPSRISIQIETHPDPLKNTFILLIDGRLPLPEDGILSTEWNLGDGTIIEGLDLEIEHTYSEKGDYSVSVEVTFEGDGKEEKDKKSSTEDPDNPVTLFFKILLGIP